MKGEYWLGSLGMKVPETDCGRRMVGGGGSTKSAKKWISTQGSRSLGFYPCVLLAEGWGDPMGVVVG